MSPHGAGTCTTQLSGNITRKHIFIEQPHGNDAEKTYLVGHSPLISGAASRSRADLHTVHNTRTSRFFMEIKWFTRLIRKVYPAYLLGLSLVCTRQCLCNETRVHDKCAASFDWEEERVSDKRARRRCGIHPFVLPMLNLGSLQQMINL